MQTILSSYGFKPIKQPCPFFHSPDTREFLSDKKFDNINVTNIFTLDEYNIREYLQTSDWNIVIKSGETYYGFERKSLLNYLSSKQVTISKIGKFYKTPLNQSITFEAFNKLKYSDYSIYELKTAYSVSSYDERVYSLFHMYCYSVKQWIEGFECTSIIVPPRELLASPRTPNLAQMIEVSLNDILAAHARLTVPANLEAFHNAVRAIHEE